MVGDGLQSARVQKSVKRKLSRTHVRVSARLRVDKGRLRNQEGARSARTLAVVFDSRLLVYVLCVGAEAGQGRHGEALLELEAADLDRLEEDGGGGGGRHRG